MSEGPVKPKRFYKDVSVSQAEDGGFGVFLDGRQARTASRRALAAPSSPLAQAVAAEWDAQGEEIDRHAMPLTALLSAAIDGGEAQAVRSRAEVLNYLKSDLLCYQAEAPAALVERQGAQWGPYLEWMRDELGAPLEIAAGVIAVAQPDASIDAVRRLLDDADPYAALGLKTATAITGSAVLALAVWRGAFDADAVFEASRLDERFQEEQWGVDAEAKAREDAMRLEFNAVCAFLTLL